MIATSLLDTHLNTELGCIGQNRQKLDELSQMLCCACAKNFRPLDDELVVMVRKVSRCFQAQQMIEEHFIELQPDDSRRARVLKREYQRQKQNVLAWSRS